jgi:hypothetical protein
VQHVLTEDESQNMDRRSLSAKKKHSAHTLASSPASTVNQQTNKQQGHSTKTSGQPNQSTSKHHNLNNSSATAIVDPPHFGPLIASLIDARHRHSFHKHSIQPHPHPPLTLFN